MEKDKWKTRCKNIAKQKNIHRVRKTGKPIHIFAYGLFLDTLIEKRGRNGYWTGTHSDMLKFMKGLWDMGRFRAMIPLSPIHLSRIIRLLIPQLNELGFTIEYKRAKERFIIVKRERDYITRMLKETERELTIGGRTLKEVNLKTFFAVMDKVRKRIERDSRLLREYMEVKRALELLESL